MKTVHRKLTSSPAKSFNGFPKVIKIIVTDPYATDSSSDDEIKVAPAKRMKRYVEEIRFCDGDGAAKHKKPARKATIKAVDDGGKMLKYRGVRRRSWGKFAAEIRDPYTRNRIWIGTFDTAEEAAIGYDRVAIRLKGHEAQTNILTPPPPSPPSPIETVSSSDSAREAQISLKSPNSVLHRNIEEETEYETELLKPSSLESKVVDVEIPANSGSDQLLTGDCFWDTEIGIEQPLFLDELQWLPNSKSPEIIPLSVISEFSDVDEFFQDFD